MPLLGAPTLAALRQVHAMCERLGALGLAHVGVVSHRTRASIEALHLLQTPPLHEVLGGSAASEFTSRAEQVEALEGQLLEGQCALLARVRSVEGVVSEATAALMAALLSPELPTACSPSVQEHRTQSSWTAAACSNLHVWCSCLGSSQGPVVPGGAGGDVDFPSLAAALAGASATLAACGTFLKWAHDQIRWAHTTSGQLHLHICGLRTAVSDSFVLCLPSATGANDT